MRDHTLFSVPTQCLILALRRGKTEHNFPGTAVRRAHSADPPRNGLITFPLDADRTSAARVRPIKAMRKKSESASDLDIKAPQMTRRMEELQLPAGSGTGGSRSCDVSSQWTAHVTFSRQVLRCAAHRGPFRCSSRKFMVPKRERKHYNPNTH